jgi:hypothetical protein
MFDLQQALNNDVKKFDISMLDNECFSALTNNIEPTTGTGIGQEQFYNWIRVQFPTLFYCLELWLRKNSTLTISSTPTTEASAKVCHFIRKFLLIFLFHI